MAYQFDRTIGGIDFTWLNQAASAWARDCGGSPIGYRSDDHPELIELIPPHRPMWVRREENVYAEVIWIARVAIRTRPMDDEKTMKREVLALVAGDFIDNEFGLHAYSMHQLALSVPETGSVESFDATDWDAEELSKADVFHGNGFIHSTSDQGGQS